MAKQNEKICIKNCVIKAIFSGRILSSVLSFLQIKLYKFVKYYVYPVALTNLIVPRFEQFVGSSIAVGNIRHMSKGQKATRKFPLLI